MSDCAENRVGATQTAPGGQGPSTKTVSVALGDLFQSVRLPMPVVFFLLTVITPISFSVGPLNLTPTRLVLLALIIKLTIDLLRGRFGPIMLVDVMFFLHVVWVAVAMYVNNPDRVIEFAGSTSVEFIGAYLIGRGYIRDPATFLRLIRMLVFIMIFLLPFAVVESVFNRALILEFWDKMPGVKAIDNFFMDKRWGLDRAQVILHHPILFGLFAASAFSVCLIGLKGVYGNFTRVLFSAVIFACVFLSLSGGALMSMMMQMVLIVWAFVFSFTKARWLLLLVFTCVAYIVVDLLSNRTPIMVFLNYATFSPHSAYWRTIIFDVGMDNVWANPLFGVGLNDWERPSWMHSGSMDNFWLVMAVRYGIPGFALVAVPFASALWKIGRRNFDADQILWQLRRAWVFTFSGLAITMTTVHIWSTTYAYVFFLFGSGMWLLTANVDLSTYDRTEHKDIQPLHGKKHASSARLSEAPKRGAPSVPLTRFLPNRGK